ncbi:Outer membrane usher protein FimD/PapC [Alkalispirochaeta americana]|uniref:Outer membrane usher protein FimD/PapC n=1 Tax=Alkalispirochaeta americana TaxID=159291 RepID=A0A1N6WNJ1_9SPIO|nr:hypothetical protein [Alkalispirochaeta americana]SIQ91572.1 Outer membrane usher protein FimD/PapC [Alkalispirochaeta americana]
MDHLVKIPLSLRVVAGGSTNQLVVVARVSHSMDLVALQAPKILSALAVYLDDQTLENLSEAAGTGWLSAGDIRTRGLDLRFDRHQLTVELRVPLTALEPQSLSLHQPRQLPGYVKAENARFALGIPLWSQYRSSSVRDGESVSSLSLRFSPGITRSGWTLESDLRLDWPNLEEDQGMPEAETENTRLVWFQEDRGYRFQAGQFAQYLRGLQAPMQLSGVSFDNLEADTSRSLLPALLSRPLTVDEAGTIDVYLNDRRIRSFPVSMGQYELRDLPLAAGVNTARIEYTRNSGEVETIELIVPHAGGLLNRGAFSYALALGVEEDDPERPAGSGFFRYGFGETFTAGILADGSTRGTQAGTEIVGATPFGEALLAAYGSMEDDRKTGWAIQAGYRLVLPGRSWLPLLSTSLDYRQQDYIQPGSQNTGSSQAWQVSSSLSHTLPGEVGISLGHQYRTFHGDSSETSLLFATLARNLGPRLGLHITGTVDTRDPEEQWGLRITLSSRAVQRNLSGNATFDARESTVDLSGTAGRPGTVRLSAGGRANSIDPEEGTLGGISATASAASSRFELRAGGGITFSEGDSLADQSVQSSNRSLQFGTGLYLADGVAAVGAPGRSSFALVRPHRDLSGTPLAVRTRGGALPRTSGRLGAAFVPNLMPGSRTPISVELPGLPADQTLGHTQFILAPGYRTGTAITIVALQRLYVRGRLVDDQGHPAVYRGFTVDPLFDLPDEDQDMPPGGSSFTDDQGTFEVYGLLPGQYRITLRDGTGRRVIMEVPQAPGPLVILEDLRLQGEKR